MIGKNISHYKILDKIGEGGMGVVYKAEDLKLQRFVALKFLPPFYTKDEVSRKRFIVEAQAASGLDHPNICNIHEINETPDGQLYISMAYYEGESLRQKIKKGPFPYEETLNITFQIAKGLSAAHAENIVHRDIKPANIIITDKGEVKIVDFGLAKLDGGKLTQSLSTKGTIAYMSPEAIRDLPVDNRTDIWSLGILIFEMLTGQLPFEGSYAEPMMYSIVNEEPKLLSQYLDNVPEELHAIVKKLLNKDKKDSYNDISELLIDLKPLAKENVTIEVKTQPSIIKYFPKKRSHRYASIFIFLIVLVLIFGRSFLFPETSLGNKIAVLPLSNISNEMEEEWLNEGITDALITELAQISGMSVISRFSSMQYKGTTKQPPDIAAELGVNYLVDGSLLKMGESVKISARLIDAIKDEYIWSKEFESNLSNILGVQSKIAETVARQIQVELTPQDELLFEKPRTVNPEAYVLYTKGLFHLNKLTPEGIKAGINYLHQAVAIDSTDPLPYAQLAVGYGHIAHSSSPEAIEALNLAGEAANKALELDENIAEAHLAQAMRKIYHNWDIDGAEKSYKRAIELNPSFAYAHFHYAFLLALKYNSPNAHEEIEQSKILDPLSPFYPAELGWFYYFRKEYDKAIEEANYALELSPDFPFAYFAMGQAYSGKKMHAEAIKYQTKVAEMTFDWKWGLGHAYAVAGKNDEAIKVALELENRNAVWDTWCIAVIYSGLGNKDKVFYWLEEAYKRKHPYILWIKRNPYFNFLQDDPRFIDLITRLNLPE